MFNPFFGPGRPQPPSVPPGADPSGAEALYRGLELLFRGLADLQAASVSLPPNVPLGAPTGSFRNNAFTGGPGPSLYPGMEDTPDDFGEGPAVPFSSTRPPLMPQTVPSDVSGLAAYLRDQWVPEHQIVAATSVAPALATPGQWPYSNPGHAPEGPTPPPAPTPFPTPDSQCEEAQQQRQDATRVPKLRADPQLFLEKVYYYLSLVAAKRDAATTPNGDCDVAQLRANYGDFIDERVECIDCLPGTCPRFPAEHPAPVRAEEAGACWDECYALLRELIAQGVCDAEDEAVVLAKIGDRPVPRPEFAPDAPLPTPPAVPPAGRDPEAPSAVA